jgi:HK97 family phage portal protein
LFDPRDFPKQKIGFKQRISLVKSAIFGNPNAQSFQQSFLPSYGEPPRRSTADWIDLYSKSPRMNPVHQIASDVGCACYGVYNKYDKNKFKKETHRLYKLLQNPCLDDTITEYALFYLTMVYLLLPSGEAFWIKERNALDVVTQLWPVPPSWVFAIPSQGRETFQIYPQGNTSASLIEVPTRDMVYFKKPDAYNPYLRGMGRAEGIGDELETDEYMAKQQKRFFWNNAIPKAVGMMPGADDDAIDRVEKRWNQKYGGYNNQDKMAWLNWDAQIKILKETNKDMDFVASRKYLRDLSNQHFCIPPELFGILENSNRSTIDAAYYLYTKNVLRKELKFIDDTINKQLTPDFGTNIYVQHDNVVPEDKEFELQRHNDGLKWGGLTVDEWRISNGYDPLPDDRGQILYTPLNMIPTPVKEGVEIPDAILEQNNPNAEKGIKKKELTQQQKIDFVTLADETAEKQEKQFISTMKKYFQKQQNKVNESLKKSYKKEYDIEAVLDWDKEAELLYSELTPLWLKALEEGYKISNSAFGLGISFDLVNPKLSEWVEKEGLEKAKGINDTTKDALRKTLTEGINEGESIPKLRDRVSSVYSEAKDYRATLIARTETMTSVNVGALNTYKAADVKQKEWSTAKDNRVRPEHSAIEGEVVDIDKPFSNGLMQPGEPNCRCALLPVI